MKLYYSPGTCSLSPHIALRETGLPFDLVKKDLNSQTLEDGSDYRSITPKGYVPALLLDDGEILTEGPAIVQYIADLAPDKQLAPSAGTMERVRLQEWLNYIASELHKTFSLVFKTKASDDRKAARELLDRSIDYVARVLESRQYLMGERFTVADCYLFTVLSWADLVEVDLSRWASVTEYLKRVGSRPTVQAALKAEGRRSTCSK